MVWDELSRDAGDENRRDRDRWIAVYIGVLAVILAICSMGGDNAGKEATLKNIQTTNTWAFFQAKNVRRQIIRVQIDQLELTKLANPAMPPDAIAAMDAKLSVYRKTEKDLTSEPEKGEGMDELYARARNLEAARDIAMSKDPYFDYGEALLQIAIVLAGVAIISGGTTLLWTSGVMGLLGTLMTVNGFTLLFNLPLLG